ncbi:MAG: biotin/lipoyl-containing protein [Anaerolineae bacterium]
MKYYVTAEGYTYEIDIQPNGEVLVNGERLQVDMQRSGRLNLYSLLVNHASYEVVIEPDAQRRNAYEVLLEGARFEVQVEDERSRRLSQATFALQAPAGELILRPPIPGLIVSVPVEAGQLVEKGDTLVIFEAMKMQNEIRAPRDGLVREVRVRPGMQVTQDDVLMIVK